MIYDVCSWIKTIAFDLPGILPAVAPHLYRTVHEFEHFHSYYLNSPQVGRGDYSRRVFQTCLS